MLRFQSFSGARPTMMRPGAKVEKAYLYPKSVELQKTIDGLAMLVELDINPLYLTPCFSFSVGYAHRYAPANLVSYLNAVV
jgi:hypothetical protein